MAISQQHIITVFPNPARGKIVFNIGLVKDAEFLEIFDCAGRFIRRLTIPNNQTGGSTVSWNGKDKKGSCVQSGVYFAKLGSRTIKFLFIK